MAAIVSSKYKEIESALAADPIIRQMAQEIPAGIDMTSMAFMSAAGKEYRRRGGKISGHIGGPAAAIASLVGA
jgi:hypothetical protein